MSWQGTTGNLIETERKGSKMLSVEWQISSYRSLSTKVNDYYKSPLFSFNHGCWTLCLFPLVHIIKSDCVIVSLEKSDNNLSENIHLELTMKNVNGVEIKKTELEISNDDDPWSQSLICLRTKLYNLAVYDGDTLIITCNLSTDMPRADVSIQTDICTEAEWQLSKQGIEEWQKSLLKLLEGGNESDVVIKVKDKEFPAHRLILQARSAVFEAMFSHDMVEKQSGMVTMEDCNPNTFSDFLKYVYTGSMDLISTRNVFGLYFASDKYDMKKLKEQCANFIKRNLTVATFCETITLAVKFQEKELIELATEFFCANTVDIAKTVEWQAFLAENPTVGNELFILSCSQKK